jgi:hypothetical protein
MEIKDIREKREHQVIDSSHSLQVDTHHQNLLQHEENVSSLAGTEETIQFVVEIKYSAIVLKTASGIKRFAIFRDII